MSLEDAIEAIQAEHSKVHTERVYQDLLDADTILGRYLGPLHVIRKELNRMIINLERKLGKDAKL